MQEECGEQSNSANVRNAIVQERNDSPAATSRGNSNTDGEESQVNNQQIIQTNGREGETIQIVRGNAIGNVKCDKLNGIKEERSLQAAGLQIRKNDVEINRKTSSKGYRTGLITLEGYEKKVNTEARLPRQVFTRAIRIDKTKEGEIYSNQQLRDLEQAHLSFHSPFYEGGFTPSDIKILAEAQRKSAKRPSKEVNKRVEPWRTKETEKLWVPEELY